MGWGNKLNISVESQDHYVSITNTLSLLLFIYSSKYMKILWKYLINTYQHFVLNCTEKGNNSKLSHENNIPYVSCRCRQTKKNQNAILKKNQLGYSRLYFLESSFKASGSVHSIQLDFGKKHESIFWLYESCLHHCSLNSAMILRPAKHI